MTQPPFRALWLLPDYLKNAEKIIAAVPKVRLKLARVHKHYLTRPGALQRTPLVNNKRPVYHTRVGLEYRLIDTPLDGGHKGEVALLYLDHHDDANQWGAQYEGDPYQGLGDAPVHRHVPAEVEQRIGDLISEKALHRLGVPEILVAPVAAASADEDLSQAFNLDPELANKIEHRILSTRRGTPIRIPVPAVESPAPIHLTADQLPTFLRVPVAFFLKQVTGEQKSLIQRSGDALYVIRGAAGSGKTIIGVRRIEHLLLQPDIFAAKPLLFTCYNNVLAATVTQMLRDVLNMELAKAGVQVTTAYRLVRKALKDLGDDLGSHNGARKPTLLRRIAAARSRTGPHPALAEWSDTDVLDEIEEVIYGLAIWNKSDYLTLQRIGRGRSLRREGREAVWAICRAFHVACRKAGSFPWSYFPTHLLRRLQERPVKEPTFRGIVIDEVQDLPPSLVRCLVALQADEGRNMLVLGDAAQNVYRRGFSWTQLGLTVRGTQSILLKSSHRSTEQIITAARPLVLSQGDRLGEDLVMPEAHGARQGPKVQIFVLENEELERDRVALAIEGWVNDGVAPSSIGVLIDSATLRSQFRESVGVLGLAYEDVYKETREGGRGAKSIDVFDPSVKFLTTGSAKGLEFPVLFIPHVTSETFGIDENDPAETDRRRRSLYTAMMRAGHALVITTIRGRESPLLRELDASAVEWQPDPPA